MSTTQPFDTPHEHAPRIVALITGAILLKFGFIVSSMFPPLGNPLSMLTMVALYGSAFALVIVAIIGIDFDRWGRPIAYGLFGTTLLAAYTAYATKSGGHVFGTDGILFSRYAVDLLLSGQNPYAHSMEPAFEQYAVTSEFVTYKRDASTVASFSYPALAFLWFVPQALLGIANLNLTTVAVVMVCLGYLIRVSPRRYAVAPFAVLFADPSILAFSYGGVFDILWVLPVLIGMRYWVAERYIAASFILGLAFATKQTPWFIAPFLAVWVFHERDTLRESLITIRNCAIAGFAGFILPNIPFLLWNPTAWVEGVLTPVSGGGIALVKQGQGLVLLSVTGTYPLPKSFYTLSMLTVLSVSLLAYTLYYDRLKWALWVVPMVTLWFNYRSLQNYFVFFIPIAYLAIVLSIRTQDTETPADATRPHHWTPNRDLDSKTRRRVLAGVGSLAVGGLTLVGTSRAAKTRLDADVMLTRMSDPLNLHRISQLTFTVTNHEETAIEPVFHISHTGSHTHAYWSVRAGPDTLAPGETATYVVQPNTPANALPYGGTVVMGMNDTGTENGVILNPESIEKIPYTTLLNPSFGYWSSNSLDNTRSPFRWTVAETSPGPESPTIEQTETGVSLDAEHVSRSSGAWELAGLQQKAPFPETIHIEATPETVVSTPEEKPPHAAGIEFGEADHRLWVVFADVENRQVITREGELDYVIVYVPATPGERTSITVDVPDIYQTYGWDIPPKQATTLDGERYIQRRGNLLAFAATYPIATQDSSVVFHSIDTSAYSETPNAESR